MTKTDFIKARLEYLKLVLTSIIGALFLLFLYQVQNPIAITVEIKVGYTVCTILFIIFSYYYSVLSKELKLVD